MPTQSPVSWPWWWLKAGPLAGAEKAKGCTHPPESFPKRPMLPLELRGFFWLYGFSYINWPDPASLNYLCICFYYFWSFLITLLTEKIIKRIKRNSPFLLKEGIKSAPLIPLLSVLLQATRERSKPPNISTTPCTATRTVTTARNKGHQSTPLFSLWP